MSSNDTQTARAFDARIAYQWFRRSVREASLTLDELRHRERHLQILVDRPPAMIWSADPLGDPLHLNKRMIAELGIDIPDLIVPDRSKLQMLTVKMVHPDDEEPFSRTVQYHFSTGTPFALRLRQRRANGSFSWMEARGEPVFDELGRIAQWYRINVSIDEEIRVGEALHQAQDRLADSTQAAGLAELSASIAHAVNQPLAAITVGADALERWLEAGNVDRAISSARAIVRDAKTAAEFVDRIRTLFKGTPAPVSFATSTA